MGARPTTERPPKGLNAYWSRTFDHAVKVLKDREVWAPELKPLVDEYVLALRAAELCRDGWAWLEQSEDWQGWDEKTVVEVARAAQSLSAQWDRHVKRAQALADQLALSVRGRRAVGLDDGGDPEGVDPLDQLDDEGGS